MITVKKQKSDLVIKLPAECDLSAAVDDSAAAAEAMGQCTAKTKVRIDAGDVKTIDTAYLQLLRSMTRDFRSQQITVVLEKTTGPLKRIMMLYGFDRDIGNS